MCHSSDQPSAIYIKQENKEGKLIYMDGWMDGWMDRQMDGWIRIDGQTDGHTCTNRQMDKRTDG